MSLNTKLSLKQKNRVWHHPLHTVKPLESHMKCINITFILLSFLANAIAVEPVTCRNLLVSYDSAELQAELRLVEEEYMPRHPSNDNWTAIPLRNATGTDAREGLEINNSIKNQKMLPCQDTRFLEQLPYISWVLKDIAEKFDTEVGIVRISKVPSHKTILPHKDGNKFDIEKGTIYRLHIPIVTGEDVIFNIDDKKYHLEPGNLYYTNVSKKHGVINNGPIDRVHLVIDVQASDALFNYIIGSPEL